MSNNKLKANQLLITKGLYENVVITKKNEQ